MKSLYLCYFGLREPLVQTQVLPYLRQIGLGGVDTSLLTFEPRMRSCWSRGEIEDWSSRLSSERIRWFSLPYHKRPTLPATLYDIARGALLASRIARSQGLDVLHARGHVSAAMGLLAKRSSGGRLIFDIRGFMPEEYVDAGLWPSGGALYRWTKAVERRLLAGADGFVVLTERARQILFPDSSDTDPHGRPIEVIPCCVDLERFEDAAAVSREEVRKHLGLSGRRVYVYVGALGGWYLTQEMARFLATAHAQDASSFTMVLTQSPPEMIAAPLQKLSLTKSDYFIRQVPPREVPRYLKAADVAVSFIKPCFSKLSSSPTKIAEYLAAGLPVICNTGVGDLDEIIEADRIGVLIREFSLQAYQEAQEALLEMLRDDSVSDRCRGAARRRFDLKDVGGPRYQRLYRRLFQAEDRRLVPSEALP